MKKKTKILLISIMVLSIIIATSYALWALYLRQEDKNVVTVDCFKLSFTDENAINLENAIPYPDNEGSVMTPYQFTIKNVCSYSANYDVNLETYDTTTLDASYLKYKINEEAIARLGDVEATTEVQETNAINSRTLASGVLDADEEATYTLRLWIDNDTTIEQTAGKSFKGKVIVIASLNTDAQVITLNANGGTISKSKIIKSIGKQIGTLPTPTTDSSTNVFTGWYSDVALTNEVTSSTIITNDLTNLYAKYETIEINENGYNYWNDNFSGIEYTGAPALVYKNYDRFITNNDPAFVRTNYVDGVAQGWSDICLNYNNIVFCDAGSYFTNGQPDPDGLKNAMATAFGEEPNCYWYNYGYYCKFGEYYCRNGIDHDTTCGNDTKSCYIDYEGKPACETIN
ncbi:MAG: InlB B-repeat-containing protein [Bacilli bacterium]|nr:InlB B-repeat-containing protein [Bacilli bacterium]